MEGLREMEELVERQGEKMLNETIREAFNGSCGTSSEESLQLLAKHGSTDVEKNKADPMGDGDQSLIFNRKKADWIRNMWSTGGDVEDCVRYQKLPAFAFACMAGDFEKVEEELNRCEGATEKIKELLETRYSSLRFSSLFFAVVGYVQLASGAKRNREVVDLLIRHGARVDARDVIGKNVIHYICGPLNQEGDDTMLAMANSCIARAKELDLPSLVDMQDRTGAVPLMQGIMLSRVDLVEFLCTKHRADVSIKDNDGMNPQTCAGFHPTINSIVGRCNTKNVAAKIKSERKCFYCNSQSKEAIFQCSRCRLVYYCSRECQKAHWKAGHKKECDKTAGDGVHITPSKIAINLAGGGTGNWKGEAPKGIKFGEKFDIKIQASETLAGSDQGGMLLYNKDKSLLLSVHSSNCSDFQKLFDVIHAFQPFAGRKAYFQAKIEEKGKLFVCTSQVFVNKW